MTICLFPWCYGYTGCVVCMWAPQNIQRWFTKIGYSSGLNWLAPLHEIPNEIPNALNETASNPSPEDGQLAKYIAWFEMCFHLDKSPKEGFETSKSMGFTIFLLSLILYAVPVKPKTYFTNRWNWCTLVCTPTIKPSLMLPSQIFFLQDLLNEVS